MCKFVVFKGNNYFPGSTDMSYQIFDTVTFDPRKDLVNQMRKYSYRRYFEEGKQAKKLRKEVFCYRRNIFTRQTKLFAGTAKIFSHEYSSSYYVFVPMECFNW